MTTWLVTGANRGIGLALVRELRERGDVVFAACRKASPELEATGANVLSGIDVTDSGAPTRLLTALGDARLDRIVHNAGILERGGLSDLDLDGVRRQLEVNAVAPLALTATLAPKLAKGARIALVTSRMGSVADNGSGGMYGYRMSKAALNAAGKSLAVDLRDRGVFVAIVHPGFIRTEMTGGAGNDEPDVAAKGILARIEGLTAANTGTFWHANGEVLPW